MKKVLLFAIALAVSAPILSAQTAIRKVKLLVPTNDRWKEVGVTLIFGEDKLILCSKGHSSDCPSEGRKELPYAEIRRADYRYGQGLVLLNRRRTITIPPLVLPKIPGALFKAKRHWFTIESEDDITVLRLNKGNFRLVVGELEGRVDTDVEITQHD